jgi:hypothetical protein
MVCKIGEDVSLNGEYFLPLNKLQAVVKFLKATEKEIITEVLQDVSCWHRSDEEGNVYFYYKKPLPNTVLKQYRTFYEAVIIHEQRYNRYNTSKDEKDRLRTAIAKYKKTLKELDKLISDGKGETLTSSFQTAKERLLSLNMNLVYLVL